MQLGSTARWRGAVLLAFGSAIGFACREPAPSPAVDESRQAQVQVACAHDAAPVGHAEPSVAFQRYAEALKAANWCDAIGAFAPQSRADVVESTFKGLLLLSGTDNPDRAKYAARLRAFCKAHRLDYASPDKLVTLTVSLMNGRAIDAELAPFRRVAGAAPEALYQELMTLFSSVDPAAMLKFEPTMNDIVVDADNAQGTAVGNDGRSLEVHFIKTATGWFLIER
jgi:hypothetical protein